MDLSQIAQGGVFSTADAARVGLDSNALRRLVREGRCLRLTRGWFAVQDVDVIAGERLHVLTSRALGRQYAPRAAVSHHSRLLLGGLPTYAADLATVHLTSVVDPRRVDGDSGAVQRRNATVRRPGVVVHEPLRGLRLAPSPARPAAGRVCVVPVAVALVQAGLLGGPEAFLVPADAAARSGVTTREEVAEVSTLFRGHTGIGPVRAALPWVDGRHESPGETRSAHLLRSLGFEVEPQVELVVERRRYRPDFRIRGTRVLVEFDGAVKYAGGGESLFAEKQREDALRRAGWVVVRLVWADLSRPHVVLARVRAALAIAA
ncbi:type IV toxin-antitoxin system AbiEi family antitoxin domain-containing protein [Terracoccus sp. 273MFTsu3.1]|uniref:type IV toxin-antitoxin system AbiEi family antitoxin domain-containing protein n=1 Tax=Terracoccus sp. 273MFTsu3.1 TaxID=1172188 RepID=UPI00036FC4D5|nr:type IV toxin-antitoxin system AbiEi family antitoxin domain-containing protein [Terracoccus sp. 273MFTsu3.1]